MHLGKAWPGVAVFSPGASYNLSYCSVVVVVVVVAVVAAAVVVTAVAVVPMPWWFKALSDRCLTYLEEP